MSTNDPFSTTPQQPGSPQDGSAWQPAPMPEPEQPDVRTYDYGAQGYAAPQGGGQPTAPGFSGGEPAPQYGAPQYGAPQYGAPSPYYGAPAPAPTSTDGVSIGALITGILGLTLIPVVLGIVGLRRTSGGIRKGRGMAIAGLILGIVSTIAWAIAIYFIVALVQNEDFQEGFQSEFESGFESDPFTSGETYGDDPALDALWDQCEVGDDVACDDLYWGSPIGSGYEEFGRTCGGRSDQLFGGRCDE